MKKFTLLMIAYFMVLLCTPVNHIYAQAPTKEWDARFGGNSQEHLSSIIQTNDGGYIMGGWSLSGISGDKSQNSRGFEDFWVVKTNSTGIKQWDARFGGLSDDYISAIKQTTDGGFILGGSSISGISGDKTQASQGQWDYWVVKINNSGVMEWDARFGGNDWDQLSTIEQTFDGGYLLGGYSNSGISGDQSQTSRGGRDYWIVKINNTGTKEWDKRFGGNSDDHLIEMKKTPDGGFILGGYSESGSSGDKTQVSQGGADYWIVKIDISGLKLWDYRFGGNNADVLMSLDVTSDGGYILGGYSASGISGDKTQDSRGGEDYWVVRLNGSGIKEWDARFGGNGNDRMESIEQTNDGGFALGGWSNSGLSGDKSQNTQGLIDMWMVKINSYGVKIYDVGFGGSGGDELYSMRQTADEGFILGGNSDSGISGDKSQNSQGLTDYWVVKLTGGQGITNNIFPGSLLADNDDNTTLQGWLGNVCANGILLYRKSLHGGNSSTFRTMCSGQGPTIVLIKTTTGRVFGAYETVN